MAKKKKGLRKPVSKPEPLLEEPFMASDPPPKYMAQRPKTSPYTSSLVTLRIGPERREYYVLQQLLQNPAWIASSRSWEQSICLPDVDESTGHVLVHYLYTGAYQTLDNMDTSPAESVHTEFKRAILSYITAKTYELHGLQQLARQKIEHFGAEMTIFDIIQAIKEDFSSFPNDATWFHDYLSGKAKVAFEEDHTAFVRNDLLDCIGSVALIKVVARCVVDIYSNKFLHMLSTEKETASEISDECITDAQDITIEEPPAKEAAFEDCPVEASPDVDYPDVDYPAEVCPVEACPAEEALIEEAPTEEASSEELNWEPESFEAGDSVPDTSPSENIDFDLVPDAPAINANEAVLVEENTRFTKKVDQPTEIEGEICSLRAKHLLEGDQWKTCKKCCALLHQVSIELVRRG